MKTRSLATVAFLSALSAACGSDGNGTPGTTGGAGGAGATSSGGTAGAGATEPRGGSGTTTGGATSSAGNGGDSAGGAAGTPTAGAPAQGGAGGHATAGTTAGGSAGHGTAGSGTAGSAGASAGGQGGSAPQVMLDAAVYAGNIDEGDNGLRLVTVLGELAAAGGAGGAGGAGPGARYLETPIDHSGLLLDTQIDAVAFSPDGTRLAVAGRGAATGAFTIYELDVATLTATAVIESDARGVVSMQYSPDGAMIAFITGNGSNDLFVGSATGDDTSYQEIATGYVTAYDWMPDSSALVYVEASSASSTTGALLRSPLADPSTPVSLRPSRTLHHVEVAASGDIYHLYDPAATSEEARLYTIDADGTNAAEVDFSTVLDGSGSELSVPTDGPRMNHFALSPDSTRVVVSFDAVTADNFQLFVKTLGSADNARLVSNVGASEVPAGSAEWGPSDDSLLVWSPDATQIAVGADWPVDVTDEDDALALWLVPASGATASRRLLGDPTDDLRDAERASWTHSGAHLFVYGDLEGQNDYALYLLTDLTTENQSPAAVRVGELPIVGLADYAVMP